jgi:shikimate dehydrogenase
VSMRLGLLGKSIGYSKSPLLHLEIARHLDVDLFYEIIDIEFNDIKNYIDKLRHGEYQGFNVTIPYKTSIMPFLDVVSSQAKEIGAVNTVYMEGEKVVGDNTDIDGFLGMLDYYQIDFNQHQNVCILGTGGAAKAVYYALAKKDVNLQVVTRSTKHISEMFKKVTSYENLNSNSYDLIVQATPIGTYPNIEQSPLTKNFVKDKIVLDLIYNPKETQIMKYAKKGYNGTMMLILQGLKSASLFYQQSIKTSDSFIQSLKEVIESE